MGAQASPPLRIYRHLSHIAPAARGGVVAIGNFDGVHRGHQAVIGEAVRRARELGAPAAILTFDPHPRRFFRPDGPPFLLTRFRTKARVLRSLGIEVIVVLRFNPSLASLTAEQFLDTALLGGLAARHVIVGADFVFGRGRQGNPDLLRRKLGDAAVTVTGPVTAAAGEPVISSTAIRDCLVAGNPRGAAHLLGRPFEIEGHVRRGDQRGRLIGFPTANIWLGDYVRPALGVYSVRVRLAPTKRAPDVGPWNGVANLGLRPTFGGQEPRLEVHLFDFAGDLYGRGLCVELVDFLRPERKFDGIETLREQIAKDAELARAKLLDAVPPGFI
jgi:riboflavin kinase / FMN adenylyltransferase